MVINILFGSAINNNLKQSGILLHPTSLPSRFGIGDLGPQAYKFVDDLFKMEQSYWQILPIGPPDLSNSPYSLLSTFAGNPLLISFEMLIEDGILLENEILNYPEIQDNEKVDFDLVKQEKNKIFEIVCKHFDNRTSLEIKQKFEAFCHKHNYWLDNFSLFCSLKEKSNWDLSWKDWDENIDCSLDKIKSAKVLQFIFHYQWEKLRLYCHKKGIQIIGDMPIYVSFESADVWQNKELFLLKKDGSMQSQAGCPPCNYNKNGQLWGNPIYNWDEHSSTNYKWWTKRFQKLYESVDQIRLDHFIGFSKYWEIPANQKTAKNGVWRKAPGSDFFKKLFSNLEYVNVIAEDLGDVDEDVITLRDEFNFPGMHIIQFDFENENFNMDYQFNSILFTGTHDNDTLINWIKISKPQLENYFKIRVTNWDIIKFTLNQKNKLTIFPLQDLLNLNGKSRFNTPGTFNNNNWTWRFIENQISTDIKQKMKKLVLQANRNQKLNVNPISEKLKEAI